MNGHPQPLLLPAEDLHEPPPTLWWGRASNRRGRPPGKHRKREPTDEEVARLAVMVAEGATRQAMQDAFKAGQSTIELWILRFGLEDVRAVCRPRRGGREPNTFGIVVTARDVLRQAVRDGLTLQQTGDRAGVTRERIRQVLNYYGCAAARVKHCKKRMAEAVARRRDERRVGWMETEAGLHLMLCLSLLASHGYWVKVKPSRFGYGGSGWCKPGAESPWDDEGWAPVRRAMPRKKVRLGKKSNHYPIAMRTTQAYYCVFLPDGRQWVEPPDSARPNLRWR
jgi:hypothetical protein